MSRNAAVNTKQKSLATYPSTRHVEAAAEAQPLIRSGDDCPNGGYGWVCVAACFLINAHTWGLNSAYAIFLAYYLDNDVFPAGSALNFAFVGGLSLSMAYLISPIATTVVRLYGTRTCCLIGIALETAAFIGASFASRVWHLFLSQGLCFGWGIGFIFMASINVVPQWFSTKRSIAVGISFAGSGFGGLVYALATDTMIDSVGLPWTFRILGIICCGVNTACTILLRDRNRQAGATHVAFDYKLFRHLDFNLFQGWGFFSMLGWVILTFSLPNYASDIGLNAKQGSIVSAMFQLGQMFGRPCIGYFSDTFGRINMAASTTFLAGLFCLVVWTSAVNYGLLLFFGFIAGLVAGTFWSTVAPVAAEVSGLESLPSVLSITEIVVVLPSLFSEAIALEIVEKTGAAYLGAQLFAGFTYIGAAACLWGVRVRVIGKNELAEAEKIRGMSDRSDMQPKVSSVWKRLFLWRKV